MDVYCLLISAVMPGVYTLGQMAYCGNGRQALRIGGAFYFGME